MNILGTTKITEKQAADWALSKGCTKVFANNATQYWLICRRIGVNPVIAYCQYALETGWGKFGGVLDASFKNPCGLKIPAGGGDYDANAHKRFPTWTEGIAAHIDHLALYAGKSGYPKEFTEDPRHFPYLLGKAKTVRELGGNWAPSSQYGTKLENLIKDLENYAKTH